MEPACGTSFEQALSFGVDHSSLQHALIVGPTSVFAGERDKGA